MPTSLGPAEILVILVVALIVLGPKRLPEAGRQVGKAIAEVRRWTTEVTTEIQSAVDIEVPPHSTVVSPVTVPDTSTAVVTSPASTTSTAVVAPETVAEAGPALVADHAALAEVAAETATPEAATPEMSDPHLAAPESARLDVAAPETAAPRSAVPVSPEPPAGDPARL